MPIFFQYDWRLYKTILSNFLVPHLETEQHNRQYAPFMGNLCYVQQKQVELTIFVSLFQNASDLEKDSHWKYKTEDLSESMFNNDRTLKEI